MIQEDFKTVAQLPGIIGCIDGTHIPVQSPGGPDESSFRNRKGDTSLNIMVSHLTCVFTTFDLGRQRRVWRRHVRGEVFSVKICYILQVVCDANLRFIHLMAKFPGAAHDSYICRMSILFDMFEKKELQGLILGDCGYPCRPWLLTPIRNPKSAVEREFNRRHKKTRVLVEQAIGMLKRRFKILDNKIRIHINQVRVTWMAMIIAFTMPIISATGVGHHRYLHHPPQHHSRPQGEGEGRAAVQPRGGSQRTGRASRGG